MSRTELRFLVRPFASVSAPRAAPRAAPWNVNVTSRELSANSRLSTETKRVALWMRWSFKIKGLCDVILLVSEDDDETVALWVD